MPRQPVEELSEVEEAVLDCFLKLLKKKNEGIPALKVLDMRQEVERIIAESEMLSIRTPTLSEIATALGYNRGAPNGAWLALKRIERKGYVSMERRLPLMPTRRALKERL